MHRSKNYKKIQYILLFVALLFCATANLCYLQSQPELQIEKKRIYIANLFIDADVSETIRESIVTKLKSHLVERFSADYNIISQSDLDLLLKQVEIFQRQGKDSKEILSEISDARDADEMIHGKVFKDNGQIKLLLNNLKRDPKTKDFFTKSIVDISFFESDFDFFIKEAAIKILNPRYRIKSNETKTFFKKDSNTKPEQNDFTETKIITVGTVSWGNFEGLMKWEDAVDVCESKGMRLPTPEELRDMAHLKNHILREPCCVFWTSKSNSKDSDYAYYIDINDGYGNFYHKEIDVRVRCVKK